MTADAGTVLWAMLTSVDGARNLLHGASVESGFRATLCDEDCINIAVPLSLRKRRRAVRMSATVRLSARGADVVWTADQKPLNHGHLAEIEERLPEGVMDYQGLEEAASRAGLSLGGRTELRAVVRLLARGETVLAVGKGNLNDAAGYVVLTSRRFLVIETSVLGSRTLFDAPHGSIEALSLGKRSSGETIRVALPSGPIVVSRLGHGEGYGVVKSFREEKRDRERFVPSSAEGSPASDSRNP